MRQAHFYLQRHITTLIYFHISLPIPICRPWTSLGSTVFMQIVSSYNYERLIRSISTPNVYALFLLIFLLIFVLIFLRPFYLLPLFVLPLSLPSLLIRSIRTYIRTPLFLLLLLIPPSLPTLYYSPLYMYT